VQQQIQLHVIQQWTILSVAIQCNSSRRAQLVYLKNLRYMFWFITWTHIRVYET
jgi:hypothetical protein